MPQPLQIDNILAALEPQLRSLIRLHLLDEVGSTNDWCVEQCKQDKALPFVCIADSQTNGKGRRGRQWYSPAAANIYMSLTYQLDMTLDELGCLPLVIGLAVSATIRQAGAYDVTLKWPNDVLVDNKKIAGVLIETVTRKNRLHAVVVGIGVNYAMPDKQMHEPVEWTDLMSILKNTKQNKNEVIDRSKLAGMLLNNVVQYSKRFERDDADLKVELQTCFLQPTAVNVFTESGGLVSGAILGINERGELRVSVAGEERVFNSADVSLRPSV